MIRKSGSARKGAVGRGEINFKSSLRRRPRRCLRWRASSFLSGFHMGEGEVTAWGSLGLAGVADSLEIDLVLLGEVQIFTSDPWSEFASKFAEE